MRAWLGITLALTGCSLVVNPRAQNEYDLVDAAQGTIPDGGEGRSDAATDAGPDGGLDAGLDVPASPVLRFPWNGYMTGSVHTGALPAERNALRPRFVWEPSEGAERYEIQLTASCEAQTRETCAFDGAIDGVTSETEWRPEAALPVSMSAPVGRRYVWRARACNAAGCSEWSQVRYLDVGRQPTDFNGDGYADVLVGAAFEGGGNAYLYQGPDLGTPRALKGFIGWGPPASGLGWTVAAVGDVNSDGFPDAVITALVEPSGGVDYAGRGYLLAGLDDEIGLDVARPVSLESLYPVSTGLYGFAVGGAGDFDGDGFGDFVIGAPEEDVDGISSAGRIYLYRGGRVLSSLPSPHVLESPTPEPAGAFGFSVSIAGDLHGDGLVDLLVGAAGESGAGTGGSGRVYLYNGASDAVPVGPSVTLVSRSPESYGGFGASVASGGDMDGDGRADLLVGAPYESERGVVHLFTGSAAGVAYVTGYTSASAEPGGGLGTRISTSGDLDGDGLRDLVIGAFRDSAGAERSGAAFVVLGAPDPGAMSLTKLVSRAPEGDGAFGVSVGVATDIDGDGRAEFLCGSLETIGEHVMAGRVYRYVYDGLALAPVDPALTAPIPAERAVFGTSVVDTTVAGAGYDPI